MSQELSLILVRHGEAGEANTDEHRSLTDAGRRHVRAVARLFAAQSDPVDCVRTSPLVRATQTAEILTDALGLDGPVTAHPEIAYPASIEQVLAVAAEAPSHVRGVMLVGHEPTLGIIARALCGPSGVEIGFRTGTLVALRWQRGASRALPSYMISGHQPVLRRLDGSRA